MSNMLVKVLGPENTYTTFEVDKIAIVRIRDILCYHCDTCQSYECIHVDAVEHYIISILDKF